MYGYSGASTVFNKEELGKNVKKLYDDILEGLNKENKQGELKVTVHRVEEKDYDPHDYQINDQSPTKHQEERQEGAGVNQGEEKPEPIEEEKVNEEVFVYQNPIIRTY